MKLLEWYALCEVLQCFISLCLWWQILGKAGGFLHGTVSLIQYHAT